MDLGALLQTAAGMAAMYWLLASACSFFLEVLNSVRNARGKALAIFISDMAGAQTGKKSRVEAWWERFKSESDVVTAPGAPRAGDGWVGKALLRHPLFVSHMKPLIRRNGVPTLPSYLPGDIFSKALLDTLVSSLRFSPAGLIYLLETSNMGSQTREPLVAALRTAELTAKTDLTEGSAALLVAAGIREINLVAFADGALDFDLKKQLARALLDVVANNETNLLQTFWQQLVPPTAPPIFDVGTLQEMAAAANALESSNGDEQLVAICLVGVMVQATPPAQTSSSALLAADPAQFSWLADIVALVLQAGICRRAVEQTVGVELSLPSSTPLPPNGLINASGAAFDRNNLTGETRIAVERHVSKWLGDKVNSRASAFGFADVRAVIQLGFLPEKLRASLRPLLANAAHDVDETRKAIEIWFDGVMERASGWYKRNCMIALGVVAFFGAVVFNIDSHQIANRLLSEAGLRESWQKVAQSIYDDPEKMQGWVARNAALLSLGDRSALADHKREWEEMDSENRRAAQRESKNLLTGMMRYPALAPAFAEARLLLDKDSPQENGWDTVARLVILNCESAGQPKGSCGTKFQAARGITVQPDQDAVVPSEIKSNATTQATVAAIADTTATKLGVLPSGVEAGATEEQASANSQSEDATSAEQSDRSSASGASEGSSPKSNKACPRDNDPAVTSRNAFYLDATLVSNPQLAKTVLCFLDAAAGLKPKPNANASRDMAAQKEYDGRLAAYVQAEREVGTRLKQLREGLFNDDPVTMAAISGMRSSPEYEKGGLGWLKSAFGFLLTALMVSLGAPFWYDLIGHFVNTRGTGGKPIHPSQM